MALPFASCPVTIRRVGCFRSMMFSPISLSSG
jgi:hypothetical protein